MLEPQASPLLHWIDPITLIVTLLLLAFGLILYFKSREIVSKSLKTSIFIPLTIAILGTIWRIGDLVRIDILDFGDFIYFFWFAGPPLLTISIIFNIISFSKLEQKSLPIWALVYNLSFLLVFFGMLLTS
jgi:hypothetical protein